MVKRNTSTHINGKRYDALSGDLVSSPIVPRHNKRSIDGVVGGTTAHATPHHVTPTVIEPVIKPARTKAAHTTRTATPHAKVHHTKPASTLMRHAVKKPTSKPLKRQTKVHSTLVTAHHRSTVVTATVAPKASVHRISEHRLKRAQQISMSPKIARYSHHISISHPILAAEQAVKALDNAIVIPQTPTPVIHYRPDVVPVSARRRVTTTSDIFEQALARATSHEEPAPIVVGTGKKARTVRRRMVSYTAGAVVVLALMGAFGYQQTDRAQFTAATSQAGFSASLPSYQPEGFAVDDVQSLSGYVGVRYKSSGNGRTFALTQKPSNLNDQTLLANILASSENTTYSTLQADGRTVYVYGRNQAAWVSDGVLYQVLGNGALGIQEFQKIAASL